MYGHTTNLVTSLFFILRCTHDIAHYNHTNIVRLAHDLFLKWAQCFSLDRSSMLLECIIFKLPHVYWCSKEFFTKLGRCTVDNASIYVDCVRESHDNESMSLSFFCMYKIPMYLILKYEIKIC